MKYPLSILWTAVYVTAASHCNHGRPRGYRKDGSTTSVQLESGRTIYYHLPASYDATKPTDVFLSFHGGGQGPLHQEALSGLSDPFFNPDGIAVYPQGEPEKDGTGYNWLPNPSVSPDTPNDLDFVAEIVQWLDHNLCVDRKYATGKSVGGGMVNLIACDPDVNKHFAAFASVSGAYYEDKFAKHCNPQRPIPMVSFHGLNDTTIPYDGKNADTSDPDDQKTYPIHKWLVKWRNINKISAKPDVTPGLFDGLVTKYAWTSASQEDLVIFYKENNLGHVWPSTTPNHDCSKPESPKCPLGHYTFNATTVIVDYLQRWH